MLVSPFSIYDIEVTSAVVEADRLDPPRNKFGAAFRVLFVYDTAVSYAKQT